MADKDALDRTRAERERDDLRERLREAKPALLAGADALWLRSEKAVPGNQISIERREQALALRALAEKGESDG